MTTTLRRFEPTLLPERFAVSQLAAEAAIPEWACFSVTRTSDELSVVCEQSRVPAAVPSQPAWSVLKVRRPFAWNEVAVLTALASPLAKAKLSLCTISTFDTDYPLVASETLSAVGRALELARHKIHRSETE